MPVFVEFAHVPITIQFRSFLFTHNPQIPIFHHTFAYGMAVKERKALLFGSSDPGARVWYLVTYTLIFSSPSRGFSWPQVV
jgi:hypothetical protein